MIDNNIICCTFYYLALSMGVITIINFCFDYYFSSSRTVKNNTRKEALNGSQELVALPITFFEAIKLASSGNLPETQQRLVREHKLKGLCYGTELSKSFMLRTLLGKRRFILILDSKFARNVYNDKSVRKSNFYKRTVNLHDRSVQNMFGANGQRWAHARKALNSSFSSAHIQRMREVSLVEAKNFLQKLEKLALQGEIFDPVHDLVHLTLRIISSAALDYTMNLEERNSFLNNLKIILSDNRKMMIPYRNELGGFLPGVRKSRAAARELVKLAERVLHNYRNNKESVKGTVIENIVTNTSYANDKERVADIIVMFIGGHDTTAYSICWTMLELAKNPEEQIKLRDKLLSYDTLHERANSDWLHFVIKESMRLNSVARYAGWRVSTEDITYEKTGVVIPKGTSMSYFLGGALRDEDYFADPDKFDPSRWVNPSKESIEAFFPFSVGRRNCIGQTLAQAEMKIVLAEICAKYHLSVEQEGTSTHLVTHKPVGWLLKARKNVV